MVDSDNKKTKATRTLKPKVLVTGADGLLGSNVVRELLRRHYKVRVLVQPNSQSLTLDGLDIERIEGDLLDSLETLGEAVKGCEQVFHIAAITDLNAPKDITWRINSDAVKTLFTTSVDHGVKKFLFIASASGFQFGSMDKPGDEHASFPEAYQGIAYMESKYAAARWIREQLADTKMEAVLLAPTFMLGQYDARPSSGELLQRYVQKPLPFVSPGGRNFVYVGDVAIAVVNAGEKGISGETYLLGGENISYLDFFQQLATIAGLRKPLGILPGFLIRLVGWLGSAFKSMGINMAIENTIAKIACFNTYYSSAKAIRDLDMPQTPIKQAIEESLGSLKAYGHIQSGFEGKVALISGGSRGLGYALAKLLVHKGAKVVITARTERRLLDSKQKLEAIGGEVLALTGDVGKSEDVQRIVDDTIAKFGRLDILVNNAGVSMRGDLTELAVETSTTVINTNITGSVLLSQAAIKYLVASKGSVVFVSSIAGLFGLPGASVYCASKAALTGFSESIRLELAAAGVHSGVAHIGFTEHDPEKRILNADGSLALPDRPAHHTQAQCAEHILEMIKKRKRRIVLTPVGILGAGAYRLSPALVEKAIGFAMAKQLGPFKQFS